MSLGDRSFEDAFDAFFGKRSGPGLEPISIDVVRAVVRAAVIAEREACASECEKMAIGMHGTIGRCLDVAFGAAARKIRERPEPK